MAPADAHSGCSHRVTTNAAIRVRQAGPNRFAVEATPADCVRVALHRFGPVPAWVLSGVNEGGNLGADVHHSGTVAAVREAVLHGWPGAAFSQYKRKGLAIDWEQATAWVLPVLRDLTARPVEPGVFWNVNLPHLEPGSPPPESVLCPLDTSPLPLSFRAEGEHLRYDGDYHGRRRLPGRTWRSVSVAALPSRSCGCREWLSYQPRAPASGLDGTARWRSRLVRRRSTVTAPQ